jgi:alpha-ketoglutaric semialdehyde dehydrogenase
MEDLKAIITDASADMMLTENIHKQYNNGINALKMRENVELLSKSAHPDTGKRAVPHVFHVKTDTFLQDSTLKEEVFGPNCILISTKSKSEVLAVANDLKGQLTATVWGNADDLKTYSDLLLVLQDKAGRVIINAMPTGVEVANAMVHGGPFPATTNSSTTSVGATAIYRFTRPVCFQGFPDSGLPAPLQNSNPLGILRQVDGEYTKDLIVR